MDEPDDPPGKGRRRASKGTAPVEDLSASDRERVTHTARRGYEILDILVERIYEFVLDSDGVPELPRDTMQGMLNLQKTLGGMLTQHPGLLAEVKAQGVDPEATDEDLDRILHAIDKPGDDSDEG